MKYKDNWDLAREKWIQYWRRENAGRPLMCVVARKPEIERAHQAAVSSGKKGAIHICQGIDYLLPDELMYKDAEDQYQNAARMAGRYRHFCENRVFLAESFPNINIDFGPGSMAGYLGSDIVFNEDTVWFEPCVKGWADRAALKFEPGNAWWQKHIKLAEDIARLSNGDFYAGMPDIMENLDVLASLRGAQDLLYDLIDDEDELRKRVWEVNEAYFQYFDRFYDAIKNEADGGNCYTVFQIWGPGKTAKLQCDFSAMLSPQNFRDFVLEPLRAQAKRLDTALYHLDGVDAIRHLDALMEIDEIDALQYTSGDYGPDGTHEDWYAIYDKARKAGKSLWIKVYTGVIDNWIANAHRIVKRCGSNGLFLHFPEMSMGDAERLLDYAEKNWSDIQGEI